MSARPTSNNLVPTGTTGVVRGGDDHSVLQTAGDPARHPAAVYLARLGPGSRRTMREALDTVAAIVRRGQTATTLP